MIKLIYISSIWILVGVVALLPNRPFIKAFNPSIAFSFRQNDCLAQNIPNDMDASLILTRTVSATSCPSRTQSATVFENAIIGATIVDGTHPNAIVSNSLGSTSFAAFSGDGGLGTFKHLSLEFWFTPLTLPVSGNAYLLEVGGLSGSSISLTNNTDSVQFRIYYQRGTGGADDVFAVDYVYEMFNSGTGLLEVTTNSKTFPSTCFSGAGSLIEGIQVGRLYMITLTIESNKLGVNELFLYFGDVRSGTIQSCRKTDTDPIRRFSFHPQQVLRVASTRSAAVTDVGLTADIHFLGFYPLVLSLANVTTLMQQGLFNSNPVVKSGYYMVSQGTIPTTINLVTNNTLLDVDGNPPSGFTLITIPLLGVLSYDGVALSSFLVQNSTKLGFRPANPFEFSLALPSTNCSIPYSSINYTASDGLCDHSTTLSSAPNCNSPRVATAFLCVVDQPDAPTGTNVSLTDVKVGTSRVFTIVPTDADDFLVGLSDALPSTGRMRHPVTGVLVAGVEVKFRETIGSFGNLTVFNGTHCQPTMRIQAGVGYGFPATTGVFQFCYTVNPDVNGDSLDVIGTDDFGFKFKDLGGTEGVSWSMASFTVVNPLEVCTNLVSYSATTLQFVGGGGVNGNVCISQGNENLSLAIPNNSSWIPIYLQGVDTVGGRSLEFEVTAFPTRGKLYTNLATVGSGLRMIKGIELTLGGLSKVGPMLSSTIPNVIYEGRPNYFNRAMHLANPYVDLTGGGIGNCSMTVFPGCPDGLDFRMMVVGSTPPKQSLVKSYQVLVNSRISPILEVTRPQVIFARSGGVRMALTGEYLIQVRDLDQDVYSIGLEAYVSKGIVNIISQVLTESDFSIVECIDGLETGCAKFQIYSHPSKINRALQGLSYTTTYRLANRTDSIRIRLFQPGPTGMNSANAVNVFTGGAASMTVTIDLAPPTDDVEASAGAGMGVALISIGIACGFFVLLGVVILLRKAFTTTKDVVVGIEKRISQDFHHRRSQSSGAVVISHPTAPSSMHSDGGGGIDSSILDWERHFDKVTGKVYYFNSKTHESRWDPPIRQGSSGK